MKLNLVNVNAQEEHTTAVMLLHFLFMAFITLAALMSNISGGQENQALLYLHKPCQRCFLHLRSIRRYQESQPVLTTLSFKKISQTY